MTTTTGLARVTVAAPQRRIDVALPEQVPLADLLPELLRLAGDGLPDAGQAHGGWVLRRGDGSPLSVGTGLAAQGVRDGDVLYLAPARLGWPELEYDDVVDAIAAGSRRYGRMWDGAATRVAGLVTAGAAVLLALVAMVRQPAGTGTPAAVTLAVAGILLLTGILAARAYGDAVVGATVAGFGLPLALAGGYLTWRHTSGALVGATALLLAGVVGAVGVGHGLRIFVAGIAAGCFGALGALLAFRQPVAGAAAVVLTVLMLGVTAFPLLAIRLARLPMPVLTPDSEGRPDRAQVFAAVVRADELITGMLIGHAVVTVAAAAILVRDGGVSGQVIVGMAAAGFLVRARLFPTVRQRLPLLAAGAGAAALLLTGLTRVAWPVPVGVLVATALLAIVVGGTYRTRAPGPYLGRAADVLDVLCTVGVIPAACAVLGLYGRMRGLVS